MSAAGAGGAGQGGVHGGGDPVGTWQLRISTPVGTQEVTLEIARTGGALTGTAHGAGEEVAMEELATDGRHLRWRQRITRPIRLHLAFDVVVDGDGLSGISRAGRLPASRVTGARTAGASGQRGGTPAHRDPGCS